MCLFICFQCIFLQRTRSFCSRLKRIQTRDLYVVSAIKDLLGQIIWTYICVYTRARNLTVVTRAANDSQQIMLSENIQWYTWRIYRQTNICEVAPALLMSYGDFSSFHCWNGCPSMHYFSPSRSTADVPWVSWTNDRTWSTIPICTQRLHSMTGESNTFCIVKTLFKIL